MSTSGTDRRAFLKSGALVAAPVAAFAAPAAALADDGSREALARLEDERAILAVKRAFLRRFNGSTDADCGEFLARADAVALDPAIARITEDAGHDAALELAPDGRTASYARACTVEVDQPFAGNSTVERMARLQGQGGHRHTEKRRLDARFARAENGWIITDLRLA